ncbi:MAG TPA: ABC transporter substrate-binding protein, partial [Candidatus Dormibacteraeota bacterium]|nr:ABC transporter substrate-binding protein [Candidatus Dormibacteraeota bacterium]
EADLINRQGGIKSMGGAKLRIVSADATSDPTQAAAVTSKFVTSNKVIAAIGMYASALTLTSAQVTEQAGIPLLSTGFSDTLTQRGYTHFFRIAPRASQVGTFQLTAALAIARQANVTVKKVAIVFENDAFGSGTAEGLRKAAQDAGLDVALYEPYAATITDAGPVASKIVNVKPDIILPVSYLTDGILLVRALHEAGNTAPIFAGVGGFVQPDFEKSLGPLANQIFTADTSSPDVYGSINTEYQKRYGTFMTQEAHDNAVAVSIIAQALEAHPTRDPEQLTRTLHGMDFTKGLAATMPGGHVKWDAQGNNVVVQPVMCQWQNGKLVGVYPPDLTRGKAQWPSAG